MKSTTLRRPSSGENVSAGFEGRCRGRGKKMKGKCDEHEKDSHAIIKHTDSFSLWYLKMLGKDWFLIPGETYFSVHFKKMFNVLENILVFVSDESWEMRWYCHSQVHMRTVELANRSRLETGWKKTGQLAWLCQEFWSVLCPGADTILYVFLGQHDGTFSPYVVLMPHQHGQTVFSLLVTNCFVLTV